MKIETHCHTGGSGCADGDNDLIVKKYAEKGYEGVVITNHLSAFCYEHNFSGKTHPEKIRYYYSLIEEMTEKFKKANIKSFFGMEIRIVPFAGKDYGDEFMVYGITEKMMADNKPFFTFTQKELFEFADKNGLFMYQTHPFRDGVTAGDPTLMHGAEAFNGHYHHYNHNPQAELFCEENGLIGISGTDYHHDSQPITAGIDTFYEINSESQLIDCIFKKDFTLIKDRETYESALAAFKNG